MEVSEKTKIGLAPKLAKKRRLQLISCMYQGPREENNYKDAIAFVVRDEEKGTKELQVVHDPTYIWHVNKPEFWTDRQEPFVSEDQVDEMTSPYNKLMQQVSAVVGQQDPVQEEIFWDLMRAKREDEYGKMRSRAYEAKGRMHLNANVHGTDFDIRDHWISRFLDDHPSEECANKLTKAFYDIEVDIADPGFVQAGGGFPDPRKALAPINIATMFFDEYDKGYVFILRNPTNASQADFEANEAAELAALEARHSEAMGRPIAFELKWHDYELDLIKDFFWHVSWLQPDYSMAWNDAFDAQTFIGRLERKYGMCAEDVAKVVMGKEIDEKNRKFKKGEFWFKPWYSDDTRSRDFADKKSMFDAPTMCCWLDQLILFAQLRKTAQGKRDSYSLDAIAEEELGVRKDAMPEGVGMRDLAEHSFSDFLHYNVQDVMLLAALEEKNKDVDQIHEIGLTTRTRVQRAMSKTVCLRNFARKMISERGFVMSNNHNRSYEPRPLKGDEPEEPSAAAEKFKGAFVADPSLNAPLGIRLSDGSQSKSIFSNVIDFDLSSLYPSIILAYNIDVGTQFGKLIAPREAGLPEFSEDVKTANAAAKARKFAEQEDAADIADSMSTGDHYAAGVRWFSLPTLDQLIERIGARIAGS
jgi:hypothetical protein